MAKKTKHLLLNMNQIKEELDMFKRIVSGVTCQEYAEKIGSKKYTVQARFYLVTRSIHVLLHEEVPEIRQHPVLYGIDVMRDNKDFWDRIIGIIESKP